MTILVTMIHIVVCFVLIAVILLQAGKGQGLAGAAFGSGNVDSLLGTKGADFMTKLTTVAAITFMVTCLGLSMLETNKSRSLLRSGQNSAPIDVDQIKKALEKVKAEAESKGDAETVKKMDDIVAKVDAKVGEANVSDLQDEAMSVVEQTAKEAEPKATEVVNSLEAKAESLQP